jgi:ssDNA-binding Zn-finger/Zn-ribbon topoisomerase 1
MVETKEQMEINLTDEQVESYLNEPHLCPNCKSAEIVGHEGEFGKRATQEVSCLSCGFRWADVYELASIEW